MGFSPTTDTVYPLHSLQTALINPGHCLLDHTLFFEQQISGSLSARFPFMTALYLPDDMNMAGHYHKRVNYNPFFFYKKAKTFNDNIFILRFIKQMFPL